MEYGDANIPCFGKKAGTRESDALNAERYDKIRI